MILSFPLKGAGGSCSVVGVGAGPSLVAAHSHLSKASWGDRYARFKVKLLLQRKGF